MAIGISLVMMTEQMAKKQKTEKMLIHRLAIDKRGYFLETCKGQEIVLVPCKCEKGSKLG
jgi:hypothetical protein